MLLARMGYRVLLVDRAHFPSDTPSTHLIHAPGVAALDRWGLLDRLVATGCPPITTYSFDFGVLTISGTPRPAGTTAVAYCPRRTVLDKLLLDAATEAGVELREGFAVDELLFDDGQVVGICGHTGTGAAVRDRAKVVIGADGAHSAIARMVRAATYNEKPLLSVGYYAYWSGVPLDAARWAVRPYQGFGAIPTNDGLTLLLAAWPYAQLDLVRHDLERNYLTAIQGVFGEWLHGARQEERIVGGGVPNHFRTPYGRGWALVGDAGYLKDPVTAQGITDAFHDAELCAQALDEVFAGRQSFDIAMSEYQHQRDARVLPMYEFTTQLGALEPPPPEFQQLLAAIGGHAEAMNEFASVIAGTVSPAELFDPNRVQRVAAGFAPR
jgi:flavin-dependent dehydrogenase